MSLERAKAAPLEIHLEMYEIREDPKFLDLLIPYAQNTESLRVSNLLTYKDLAYPLPFKSAPKLRSLSLSDNEVGEWDQSIDPFVELSTHTLGYLSLVGVPLYPSFLNLRTLTEVDIHNYRCNLHLDTLLDFLEGNRSLTRATIQIRFIEPSLRRSRRRAAIENWLQYLRIACYDAVDGRALISSIALSNGAELEFNCWRYYAVHARVDDILSGISTTHLSNLLSPTSLAYHVHMRKIQLRGPNGTASFSSDSDSDVPFTEFPRLPLADIRKLHVDTRDWARIWPPPDSKVFHHLSSFPALETFTIGYDTDMSLLLSPLLSTLSASPSLKTLAFLNCEISEDFMEELVRFASDRKNTTSAWLHRILIVHQNGKLPSASSIHKLRCIVEIEVQIAAELLRDLT